MAVKERPRLLIEDWLPAAAIGVECMRERSTGLNPPNARLHVWWARRPLCASRAAVLASLLPADFPHDAFERLLGFWGTSRQILDAQSLLDWKRDAGGDRIRNPHGQRAFRAHLRSRDLDLAHAAAERIWGKQITVIDPMAGGGSIPLESARLGFHTLANEYNPVACSVLEASVDYPFRFGKELARKARIWGRVLREKFNERMSRFYPSTGYIPPLCYVFAHTVPDPDHQEDADDTTGRWHTPLVPDWHMLKPRSHGECCPNCLLAVPAADKVKGTWRIGAFKPGGHGAGQLREPPKPTYVKGKGVSLFTDRQISSEYIKAMAQQGRMKNALYAVVLKFPQGLKFQPAEPKDLAGLREAEKELTRLRPGWEKANVIPTENVLPADKTGELLSRGMTKWADVFTPRQLLAMGVLVEELRRLRPDVIKAEGKDAGEAIVHLLAFGINKLTNYNSGLSFWHAIRSTMANTFDRHDFSFKPTHAEMAVCYGGGGLEWAIENVIEPYENLAELPRYDPCPPVQFTMGSASGLPEVSDHSATAIVVDPPYADNVQYSELADFFYVWLKRTQGHRRPEWFSTYLCDKDREAVVNITRHRRDGEAAKAAQAVPTPSIRNS